MSKTTVRLVWSVIFGNDEGSFDREEFATEEEAREWAKPEHFLYGYHPIRLECRAEVLTTHDLYTEPLD